MLTPKPSTTGRLISVGGRIKAPMFRLGIDVPVSALYGADYDFPRRPPRPDRTYMIATTPRSGSTLFSIEVWKTGALGAPLEYLNLQQIPEMIARIGDGSAAKYWSNVPAYRTSPNGVFGFKLFVQNMLAATKGSDIPLAAICADDVIFLRRRDRRAQARSYAKAIKSGVWFASLGDESTEPSKLEIDQAADMLSAQERSWTNIFDVTKSQVMEIFYEDFCENKRRAN